MKSKKRVPTFHEVVRWILQRDLHVTLHRVRIVVPAALKASVRHRRQELRKSGWHTGEEDDFWSRHKSRTPSGGSERDLDLFDAPWYPRRGPGLQNSSAGIGEVIQPPIPEEIVLDEEMYIERQTGRSTSLNMKYKEIEEHRAIPLHEIYFSHRVGFRSPSSPLPENVSSLGRVRTPTMGDAYAYQPDKRKGNKASAKRKKTSPK